MQIDGRAFFVKRPRRLTDLLRPHSVGREQAYHIAAFVELRKIDYENFVTDMFADRKFIEDNAGKCKYGDAWECIFVRCKGMRDGVLVAPERGAFVSWAAYVTE
ncbi:MAG: hypothetical protein II583_02825 [Oscillospiraceae bacterium]|nr:hypothetical protein [Oscillospiraceae bacterium]